MARGRPPSEEALIRRVRRLLPTLDPDVPVSIGDDAALLDTSSSPRLVISTDQLVEGVHFLRRRHPPLLLGEKALAVNLSDLAAMGSLPRWALLSLLMPADLPPDYLEGILRGIARGARRHKVSLIGGNISASKMLVLDITVLGTLQRGTRPLLRSGARPGDSIYVSGSLGGAAFGLAMLRSRLGRGRRGRKLGRDRSRHDRAVEQAIRAHLCPTPEVGLGLSLARHSLATAAMDLSDGLSLDLRRLCRASSVGALLFSDALPLDPAALLRLGRRRALHLALHGGEDYRLLFTVSPRDEPRLRRLVSSEKLHPIGRIVRPGLGIRLASQQGASAPLPASGFDHLRRLRSKR